jgi:hypothetical protein
MTRPGAIGTSPFSRRFWLFSASFLALFSWFWVLAHWVPLRAGRDMTTYFLWFRDLFQVEPEFPLLMLFRTPLTPLFYGTCFELLEETGIELILARSSRCCANSAAWLDGRSMCSSA